MTTTTQDRRLVTGGDPDAAATIPTEEQFLNAAGASNDYLPGPEIRAIAVALIAATPSLRHIAENRLTYLWKRKGGTSGGVAVLGKTISAGGLVRFVTGAEFVIWLAADNCEGFTNYALEALVFHELCHVDLPDEHGIQKLRGHDFEAFNDEVATYGAWKQDLERAKRTFAQLPLFD